LQTAADIRFMQTAAVAHQEESFHIGMETLMPTTPCILSLYSIAT